MQDVPCVWLLTPWKQSHLVLKRKYCKCCYFRRINFSRLAAQKHIRGLLNSRWAEVHLSFLYCTKLTSFNEWYPVYLQNTSMCVTGQHKNKAGLRQTWVYYPFALTHMVNTQLLRVQNVQTKYCKYFFGFLNSRLLNFVRNTRKLIYCISHYFRVQLFSRFLDFCGNSRVVNFAIFLILSLL